MKLTLVYTLTPIKSGSFVGGLQVMSWLDGLKTETLYRHGVFSGETAFAELQESISMRRADLACQFTSIVALDSLELA